MRSSVDARKYERQEPGWIGGREFPRSATPNLCINKNQDNNIVQNIHVCICNLKIIYKKIGCDDPINRAETCNRAEFFIVPATLDPRQKTAIISAESRLGRKELRGQAL